MESKRTQIATARARHRAHHIRQAARAAAFLMCACGPSIHRPDPAPVSAADYVAVTFPPRTPPIEFIPPSPERGAVWVDGSWDWDGERYGWRSGRWVLPPEGARYARWTLVRRKEDGQLFFAPSTWKDAAGATLDERSFPRLGPGARARSRPNEAPHERERDAGPHGGGADVADAGEIGDIDASVMPPQRHDFMRDGGTRVRVPVRARESADQADQTGKPDFQPDPTGEPD